MKKLITIIAALAIAGCAKQTTTINPTDNYHVVVKAYDTNHVLLSGRVTIGSTVLNIRKGFKDSTMIDTTITENIASLLSYTLHLSKVNPNCTLTLDTTGLIKLNINAYSVSGTSIVQ